MSAIIRTTYQCDHCGVTCVTDEGDGDDGWLHADSYQMPLDAPGVDLCPNCVSALKVWFRAGPQHAEERERIARQAAINDRRQEERILLARHPASNRKGALAFGRGAGMVLDD